MSLLRYLGQNYAVT